jgi:hypothetical protein
MYVCMLNIKRRSTDSNLSLLDMGEGRDIEASSVPAG